MYIRTPHLIYELAPGDRITLEEPNMSGKWYVLINSHIVLAGGTDGQAVKTVFDDIAGALKNKEEFHEILR